MPEVTFTRENLLERKQLKAGWRKLKVKSVDEKPGVNDPTATTWPTVFVVAAGEDEGVPINHWFSEKAMGRVADFLKCFVAGGEVTVGKSYSLEQIVGREVNGYVEFDIKSGYNTIKDFKPVEQKKGA